MRKLKTFELNRLGIKEYKNTPKIPLVVVLNDIRSMYNVGSIFRTSDAFLVKEIHLCGITPRPPHREIHKTAIGATESVNWKYYNNIKQSIDFLIDEEYIVVGLEQTDSSILMNKFEVLDGKKYAIVLGNEVDGISDSILDKLDFCVEIPQYGTKHSLNVSVAGGLIIHFFAEKML